MAWLQLDDRPLSAPMITDAYMRHSASISSPHLSPDGYVHIEEGVVWIGRHHTHHLCTQVKQFV